MPQPETSTPQIATSDWPPMHRHDDPNVCPLCSPTLGATFPTPSSRAGAPEAEITDTQMTLIAQHMADVAHQAFLAGFSAGAQDLDTDHAVANREAGFYVASGFDPDTVRAALAALPPQAPQPETE